MAAVRSKAQFLGEKLLDSVFENEGSLEKEVIDTVRMKAWRFGLLDAINIQADEDV